VIIMFELTGEYSIILPLMAAIVLASSLSQWLTPDTIYTLKLRRRGIDLARPELPTAPGATLVVRDVMGPVPMSVPESMPLGELAGRLAASARGVLPVTRDDGTYAGVVTARVVADALADGRHDAAAASLVLELPVTLHEDEPLDAALKALDQSGCAAVPVIDREDAAVVGWVAYPDCLRALHPASERRAAAVAEHASGA
jgi:CIC family chloride channel protein